MLKFDGRKIILTNELRKVIYDLIQETNYSGESEFDIEIPLRKKDFSKYKRYSI